MKYVLFNTNGDKFINEESYPNDDCIFDELLSYSYYEGDYHNGTYFFAARDNIQFNEFVKLKAGTQ